MTPPQELQQFLDDHSYTLSATPEFIAQPDGTFNIGVRSINVNKITPTEGSVLGEEESSSEQEANQTQEDSKN